MKKNKIFKFVFIIVIVVIIILRTLNFPNSIKELNCDEIMTVANAISISETHYDINGIKNPMYLLGWGGQSVMLLYSMVLSIKIFGYSLFAVRFPLLIVSLLSIIVFYYFTKRITKNETIAKISLIMVLISPWHILQSLWALDCNMFPHFLLLAIYVFYVAVEENKNKLLYFSMILFAVTLYCYGISVYFVPLFLVIIMLYLLKLKKINLKQLVICFFCFLIIALPIVITLTLNAFQIKQSIQIGNITLPYYKYLTRTNDMLFFSNDVFLQLKTNINSTLNIIFCQIDDCKWNASKEFGTIYHLSVIFIFISVIDIIKRIKNKNMNLGLYIIVLWCLISLLTGILINNTNINRLNSVWYPLIFLTSYGIYTLFTKMRIKKLYIIAITIIYFILFISYIVFFNTSYSNQISSSGCFSRGFIEAFDYTSRLNNKYNCIYTNFENDGCLQFYVQWQKYKNKDKYINYICISDKNDIYDIINNIDKNTVVILKLDEIKINANSQLLELAKFGEYSIMII